MHDAIDEKLLLEAQEAFESEEYHTAIEKLTAILATHHMSGPESAFLLVMRGRSLYYLQHHEEAANDLQLATIFHPDDEDAYHYLGMALGELGRWPEVIATNKKLIEFNPKEKRYYLNLCVAYEHIGKKEKAIETAKRLIEEIPTATEGYYNLILMDDTLPADTPYLKKLQELTDHPDLCEEERIIVHFALGKIYFLHQEYAKALSHFHKGNKKKAALTPYNPEGFEKSSTTLINAYNSETLPPQESHPPQGVRPLFILGISRSGKSLLAKLLSKHPVVFNADEVGEIGHMLKDPDLLPNRSEKDPQGILSMDANLKRQLRTRYLRRLQRDHPGIAIYGIDTTPTNQRHLALLSQLFPNAQYIYCKRNPLDQCLQIYCNYYTIGNAYSYSLESLGHFYKHNQRLLEHYKKVLPITIHTIQYEDLIENPKEEIERLTKELGLPQLKMPIDEEAIIHREEIGLGEKLKKDLKGLGL